MEVRRCLPKGSQGRRISLSGLRSKNKFIETEPSGIESRAIGSGVLTVNHKIEFRQLFIHAKPVETPSSGFLFLRS